MLHVDGLLDSKHYDFKKPPHEPEVESSNSKFWSITHGEVSEKWTYVSECRLQDIQLTACHSAPWKKVVNTTSAAYQAQATSISKSISHMQERMPNLKSVQERLPDLKLPSIPTPGSRRTHSRNVSSENPKSPPPAVLKKPPPKSLKYLRASKQFLPLSKIIQD